MSSTGGKQKLTMQKSIIFIILLIGSLMYLMPFLWLVRSSLMSTGQIFKMPLEWIPKPFKWDNYPQALTAMPFARYFLNTVLIVVLVEVGTLLTAPMAAFAFSRLRWRGRDTIFFVLLTSLMIPYAVTLIPTFILWTKLGAINTYLPLTVPAWFGGSAYYIFLLRQFFAGLPIEYDEAAYLDGASPWQVLWKIVIPLSKPAMITVAVFTFLGVWGDLMGPIIYLNDASKYTLAVGLTIFRGAYSTKWNLLMAASTVIMVPPIVLYFLGQRYFEQGITMGGIK
ncbi:MAG: carbohydrate ABC transporter permease [Atribacterales bacterium]|jgi:multiple sugar transport system permease protein|nr:carbohydrate ABC transporter permease [Atribacterota bacterium]